MSTEQTHIKLQVRSCKKVIKNRNALNYMHCLQDSITTDFLPVGPEMSYRTIRFYNPSISKWMTRDPLGEAGGINLYGFVGNNPVNWIDPLGLWYIDLNISLGYFGGVTGGVLIGPDGMHPYVGVGVVSPPGGIGITWSPDDPSPGWNTGLQLGFLGGGQFGYSFENKDIFWEVGFVSPGGSLKDIMSGIQTLIGQEIMTVTNRE